MPQKTELRICNNMLETLRSIPGDMRELGLAALSHANRTPNR